MMTSTEFYAEFNSMQKNASTSIMKDYSSALNWTDNETVLDVGCGPGDVSVDLILPLLSEKSKLTGTDVSPNMIAHASKSYTDERLKFVAADFGLKNIVEILPEKTFSKIFSFFCLHWIKDQKQVARNLSSLLQSGGEVLAIIMVQTTAFPIYKELSEMDKWKPYMQDVDKFISPYYNVPNIKQMVHDIFPASGLAIRACELRDCSFTFPSFENMLKSFDAVNPFLSRIPEELKPEFNEIVKQLVIKYEEIPPCDLSTYKPNISYQILILKLDKP